jgi:uncharacterized protein (DUF433 family)
MLLVAGGTEIQLLDAYPYLAADDTRAALSYGAWRTEDVNPL